jgi:translocation and assembly module TamB
MIRRRRLVLVAGLITVLLMAIAAVGSVLVVTGTDVGRGWLRRLVVQQMVPAVKGRLHVGRISGPILTGVTIDSLEIADSSGVVMVAAGKTTMRWDPRDFLDRRILVQRLITDNVLVQIIKYKDGDWNYKHIFPPGPKGAPRAKGSFGDFIVADSVSLTRGTFLLTMPWNPADSLKGARRDSSIKFNLARTNAQIRRSPRGLVRTWRWEQGHVNLSHVRLARPDTLGKLFQVTDLGMTEFDPPFRFDRVRGDVRWLGDSIWIDFPHFELPGSSGYSRGKIVWGSDLPVRYDIAVHGDKVAMKDIAWLTETFPAQGGGTMDLTIRNDPSNLNVLRYGITNMDARSYDSRIRGRMTWGVGGPVTTLTEVDLRADPLDFSLLRVFNGEQFPLPWRGQITGTVKAKGGPLHRFDVDDMRFTFRDANVPGATSVGSGIGQVDILYPAFTKFRGFEVDLERGDLRTPRFLNREFPRVNGFVSGSALLDSLWYDVRVRDLDAYHDDGTGTPQSHVTGAGRITLEPAYVIYDMQLDAQPLSFTMLGNSYLKLPVRGTMTGPITVKGTIAALEVTGQLTGDAGSITGSGIVDIEPSGYSMKGQAAFDRLDLRTALGSTTLPATLLTGKADMDTRGDSLANLDGRMSITLDRSRIDALRVDEGIARFTFRDGIATVDSLSVLSPALTLSARGGVGLYAGRTDSLTFRVTADSLGGLRPWLSSTPHSDTPDSLAGNALLRGKVSGRIDSLAVGATLAMRDVLRGGVTVSVADLTATGSWIRGVPSGRLSLTADSIGAGAVRLHSASATGTFTSARDGEISVEAQADSGARVGFAASVRGAGDSVVATIATLFGEGRTTRWALMHPAIVTQTPGLVSLDSLVLGDTGAARVRISARVPQSDSVSVAMSATKVRLSDISWLTQRERPLAGILDASLLVRGTREAPTATLAAQANALSIGTTALGDARVSGTYATNRFLSNVTLSQRDSATPLLSARVALPVTATLAAFPTLQRDAPISGSLSLRNTSLALFEAATPTISDASGTLSGELQLRGSVREPRMDGIVTLANGASYITPLGVRLIGMDGVLRFAGDNVSLPRLTVSGAGTRGGSAVLSGRIGYASLQDPSFDLTIQATNLRILERPRIATLQVSTDANGLQIRGTPRGSVLTGSVTIPTGDIIIANLGSAKNLVSIDDPEFFTLIDTTTTQGRSLLAAAPSPLLKNLQVREVRLFMGNNVWLRSDEANIKLAGDVGVTLGRDRQDSSRVQLALDGSLLAERGTYRLNLGFDLVQRTFDVERGTLRFFGEPELNPTLDITAVNVVRQYSRQDRDVPIRMSIGGTLAVPTLKLGSADPNLVLTESDAISYLFTGRPSFAASSVNEGYSSQAANLFLPTFGNFLGDKVGSALGLSQFQIETASGAAGQGSAVTSTLASTRLGGGVQIGSRTFVRATVGLCQLFGNNQNNQQNNQQNNNLSLVNSIGAKLEYRFSQWISASIGVEPPTSLLQCNNSSNARNFAPTPQQFGLDITRKWEF